MNRHIQTWGAYLTALMFTLLLTVPAAATVYETTVNEAGNEVTTVTDENGNTMVFEILDNSMDEEIDTDWEVMSAEEYEALLQQAEGKRNVAAQVQEPESESDSTEEQIPMNVSDSSSQKTEQARQEAVGPMDPMKTSLLSIAAVLVLCLAISLVMIRKRNHL